MNPTRRICAAALFGWALLVPSISRGVELLEGRWTPLAKGIAGTSATPYGMAWDSHGSLWACGPELVQAGTERLAGVGRFDSAKGWTFPGRSSWKAPSPTSISANLNLRSVVPAPDGKVWVLGDSGKISTHPLLRSFDGTTWTTESGNLGCANRSFDCPIATLLFDAKGNPVVGGTFSVSKTDSAREGLARRIEGVWTRLEFPPGASPSTLISLGRDSLAVGGRGIWIGDGARWELCGMDSAHAAVLWVRGLLRLADGTLLANAAGSYGGSGFSSIGVPNDLARWDGTGWSEFGRSVDGPLRIEPNILHLALDGSGAPLVMARLREQGAHPAHWGLLRWNGQSWDTLGRPTGPLCDLHHVAADARGRLALGGVFQGIDSTPAWNVAIRDGKIWRATDSGFAGTIAAVVVDREGGIVVGGSFSGVEGKRIANIARWDGRKWNPLGEGLDSAVTSLDAHPMGGIVAVGSFRRSGRDSLPGIARFDGVRWSLLAPATPPPWIVAVGSDGGLWTGYAEGNLVRRWTGAEWSPVMKSDGEGEQMYAIALSHGGDARLIGNDYTDSYHPRIWSATATAKSVNITPTKFYSAWTANRVVALGDSVFAYAGRFCDSCPLAREDNGVWTALPSLRWSQAAAVTADATGNLYAALLRDETLSEPVPLLRQTDGGATAFEGPEGDALLVALDSAGSVVVGGRLNGAGGASLYLLRNARNVGLVEPRNRPDVSALRSRGSDWITTRPGRMDVFSPAGVRIWSRDVEAGFSTRELPLARGLHLVRFEGRTVRLLASTR